MVRQSSQGSCPKDNQKALGVEMSQTTRQIPRSRVGLKR